MNFGGVTTLFFCECGQKVVNLVNRFPPSFNKINHFDNFRISSKTAFRTSGYKNYSKMSSETQKPILYTYFRSSASWRVRILLAHKGIDYEQRAVNLLKREQLGDEYMKICPMGQVPSLLYDGKIITQSMAILDFLEDMYPETPMIPRQNPMLKAKVLEICDIVNSGIQPLQNLSVLLKVHPDDADKRFEWAAYFISKGFTALEKILSESCGKYCVGDEITWADACLFPQAASASRFNVELEKYPTVNKIYKELGELEAFKKAHAFSQPDCPPELKAQGKLA